MGIKELVLALIPKKQQTRALKNGAWYETEWDEGYNKCRQEIIDLIDSDMLKKLEG